VHVPGGANLTQLRRSRRSSATRCRPQRRRRRSPHRQTRPRRRHGDPAARLHRHHGTPRALILPLRRRTSFENDVPVDAMWLLCRRRRGGPAAGRDPGDAKVGLV